MTPPTSGCGHSTGVGRETVETLLHHHSNLWIEQRKRRGGGEGREEERAGEKRVEGRGKERVEEGRLSHLMYMYILSHHVDLPICLRRTRSPLSTCCYGRINTNPSPRLSSPPPSPVSDDGLQFSDLVVALQYLQLRWRLLLPCLRLLR